MTGARPITVLMPPVLMLALTLATQWWDLAGLQTHLSDGLFASWQALGQGAAQLTRPAGAMAGESFLLLICGAITIFLTTRLPLYWAGLFAAITLVAAAETSWILFFTQHWLIDAATPGLGLALLFLACAAARAAQTLALRTRLRMIFSQALPDEAIARLMQQPDLLDLQGQARALTCLVCGVQRLSGLSADNQGDPKAFVRLTNLSLSALLDQVRAHGGTIDRVTADGFAAFWNAPLDDPDHVLHACQAANAIALSADAHVLPLKIGIGIATGEMITGDFGGNRFGVHGEAMTLAAQLQALSAPYGQPVIVSEETMRAAAGNFAFLEVDCIAAEGAPVKLYAMLGNPVARASPKFRALSTFHDHIFAALRGQQWGEARSLVEQCRNLSGASQSLYDLYLTRIRYFESNPPGPEWDGAFRPVLK